MSKKTVWERRDMSGEALGTALLPPPPAWTLLQLSATAPGSAAGDTSRGHPLASSWIEVKKDKIFFP